MPEIYTGEPGQDLFRYTTPQGDVVEQGLETITGGKFKIFGRGIYNTETNRFEGSIPLARPATVVKTDQGSVFIINNIDTGEINAQTRIDQQQGFAFEGQITMPDGSIAGVDLPFVALNALGKLTVILDPGTAQERFGYLTPEYDPLTQALTNLPLNAIIADPEALTERALAGALLKKHGDLVMQWLDAQHAEGNYEDVDNPSEAAVLMARDIQGGISYGRLVAL